MTENPDLEKRLSDLERGHARTREWLLGLVSIVVAMSVVFLLNPERAPIWLPALELLAAYFVIRRVTRWALER